MDDDADSAEIFEQTVVDAGAESTWERSPSSALARLRQYPGGRPHVIVSDIGMLDEDGYQFLRKVRKLPPESGGQTPIIALTAYVTPEDRARALHEGFSAHIGKPFDADTLIAAIKRSVTE